MRRKNIDQSKKPIRIRDYAHFLLRENASFETQLSVRNHDTHTLVINRRFLILRHFFSERQIFVFFLGFISRTISTWLNFCAQQLKNSCWTFLQKAQIKTAIFNVTISWAWSESNKDTIFGKIFKWTNLAEIAKWTKSSRNLKEVDANRN